MRCMGSKRLSTLRVAGHVEVIGAQFVEPEQHDERFDLQCSPGQTGTTRSGRALDIVPAECTFDFEVQTLPRVLMHTCWPMNCEHSTTGNLCTAPAIRSLTLLA